jgi:hypothetical protein
MIMLLRYKVLFWLALAASGRAKEEAHHGRVVEMQVDGSTEELVDVSTCSSRALKDLSIHPEDTKSICPSERFMDELGLRHTDLSSTTKSFL